MGQQDVAGALATHADGLNGTAMVTAANLPGGESRPELAELSSLAERVKLVLAPVRAPAAYRLKLERDLREVARQRMQGEMQIAEPAPRPEWLIGAAVALVGGIAYLLRSRSRSEHDLSATPQQRSA